MSIDARVNFALLKSKVPETKRDEVGINQKVLFRRMRNQTEEQERKMRIATSLHERTTKFLQGRLDKAEELLGKHGLLEEYRRAVNLG